MLPEKFMLPADRIPDCRDQGKLDICVAMAITAVMQILHYIKTGEHEQFSPTFAAAVWRDIVDRNMKSLNPDKALKYAQELGCCFTKDLPVMMQNPEAFDYVEAHPELFEKAAENKLIGGFEVLNAGAREERVLQIKNALVECQYPVVAKVKEKTSSHFAPIIGWDNNKELFYVMNSWGDKGGAKGVDSYKYKDLKRGYKIKPVEEEKGVEDKMIKIALDAGHGLSTSGKQTPDGIKEWALNDAVRDKVVELLKDYDVEIINVDNNEGAVDESLEERLQRYIKEGVAAFVSIHHNAYKGTWNNATGVEVYTDKNPTAEDMRLAECIYSRMVNYTGLSGRGIKQANFTVINQNKIPAVLCEGGFMDGTEDYKIITSEEGQAAYARAVTEGLVEFLRLEKKEEKNMDKFTDVKDHYAREDINELAEAGIVNGRGDGTFAPGEFITRGDMAIIINRIRKDLQK